MFTSSPLRRKLPVLLLLTVATAAVYGQAWNFSFINYDDPLYVTDNAIVQKGLTREGLRWAFTTNDANIWHPLTWLSHMLDVSLFGLAPGPHHLVNLLFHLLNTTLLFLVLKAADGGLLAKRLRGGPLRPSSPSRGIRRLDCREEGRSEHVFLAAHHGGLRPLCPKAGDPALSSRPPVLQPRPHGQTHAGQPSARTFPDGLLAPGAARTAPAQPGTPRKPRCADAMRDRKKSKKKKAVETLPETAGATGKKPFSLLLLEKIPLVIVAGIFCILAFYTQHKGGALGSLEAYPPGVRIANAIVSYALYLFKSVWPADLAVFYPYVKEIPGWQVLASAAILLSTSIAVVRFARRFPYLAFGWLWYLVTLLPVIGIVKVGEFSMADRYTYMTLIGPFIAFSWGARDLAARWNLRKEALTAAGLLVTIALAAATFIQAGTWRNSATLFRHALAVTENNFMAHTNLAVALIDEGRLDEALPHLETATKIRPDFPNAQYNLGVIRLRQGRDDEAMGHFKAALRIDPGFARASHYAGLLHLRRGEPAEAIRYFQQALTGGAPVPQVFTALADALALSSRYEEALSYYGRSLALKPDAVEVRYNAASILIGMGRVDEAIGHLREAVRIKPDYARAHNNLGSALMMQKRFDEAITHFQEAVRIDPGYTMARENLKDALAQKKEVKKSGR